MAKKTEKNPLGAGRKPNQWDVKRLTIPMPIYDKVREYVKKWEKENK